MIGGTRDVKIAVVLLCKMEKYRCSIQADATKSGDECQKLNYSYGTVTGFKVHN